MKLLDGDAELKETANFAAGFLAGFSQYRQLSAKLDGSDDDLIRQQYLKSLQSEQLQTFENQDIVSHRFDIYSFPSTFINK